MIEVLQDMPEGVTGIRVSGRLRRDDIKEFTPTMRTMLDSPEIRMVEVIADEKVPRKPGEHYAVQMKTGEDASGLHKRIETLYKTHKKASPDIFTDDLNIEPLTLKRARRAATSSGPENEFVSTSS